MEVKIEPQTWSRCFTCLDHSEECMQISSEASDSDSVTVVEALTKHFWFQRNEFTKAQHVICENCWNRLDDFHRFYQEVEENHRSLNQKTPKVCEGTEHSNVQIHPEIEVKEEDNYWHQSEDEESEKECNTASLSGEEQKEPTLTERVSQRRSKRKVEQKQQVRELDDDDEIINTHMQYNCSICGKNCMTFHQLKLHLVKVHKMEASIICCGKRFYKRVGLLEHVLKLQDPDRFKCDICDKILTNSCAVRKHKREIHVTNKEKKYRCDRCPQRFVRASMLKYHIKGHTNLDKGSIKCPYCQKSFPMVHRMNWHIKLRHASKSFVCDLCEKGFVSELDLQRHEEQHNMSPEELQAQCEICHKWLKNKNTLKMHSRLHTGPMKCDICGLVLEHYQALARHKYRKHKVKQRYGCEKCGKKFQRAIELKKHATVHYEGTVEAE